MNHNLQDFTYFIKHLRLEALALAILMVALLYRSEASLWWLIVGFPLVDICMVGYLFGNKTGALFYNLFHNAAIPTLCIATGVITQNELISVIGFVWTFHTAVDRILGYGLKHRHSFHETHLGPLKKQK